MGGHVARAFAERGAKQRLLVRSTSSLVGLEGMQDVELVRGDLRQVGDLRSALRGCDAVVHVAADYRLWVRDPDAMYAANVNATRDLLRLASELGIRRLVYTSSVADDGVQV